MRKGIIVCIKLPEFKCSYYCEFVIPVYINPML